MRSAREGVMTVSGKKPSPKDLMVAILVILTMVLVVGIHNLGKQLEEAQQGLETARAKHAACEMEVMMISDMLTDTEVAWADYTEEVVYGE